MVGKVVVVAAGDERLYGISTAGTQLWKSTVGVVSGGPVAAGDAVCVALKGGTARCVRTTDGGTLPEIKADVTGIDAADGVVFGAGADGSTGAWEATTGVRRWLAPGAGVAGVPVVRGGEVDVAYPDGRITGLDAQTGKVLWENRIGDRFAVAARGDQAGLFAVSDGGVLYALRPPGVTAVLPQPSVTVTPTPTPTAAPERTKPTTTPTRRHRTTSPTPTPEESTPSDTPKPTTPDTPLPTGPGGGNG